MKDATQYANDIAKKDNDNALAAVRKSGKTQVIELTPDEKRVWKKALVKVHDQMASRVGTELVNEIHKETGFDPKRF
jgi:C4-dicarboxylate-binding protein DctP